VAAVVQLAAARRTGCGRRDHEIILGGQTLGARIKGTIWGALSGGDVRSLLRSGHTRLCFWQIRYAGFRGVRGGLATLR
jgi:hypothetical protein